MAAMVIMGGSGSTGSSLLKNILQRSPAVFSGEESNLFCKKALYTDFEQHKTRILKKGWRGLRNYGYHLYNGIDLSGPEYRIQAGEMEELLTGTHNFPQFIEGLYAHFTRGSDPKIWMEKTPANACNFKDFLAAFDDGLVIHTVRHPLDAIASLWKRGYPLYYSCGIYLCNTAAGLAFQNSSRCLTVKYESLVDHPLKTLNTLGDFLGIEVRESMLQPQEKSSVVTQLDGWRYDETQSIKKGSVGRFDELPPEEKEELLNAVFQIQLSDAGMQRYAATVRTIPEIADKLKYHLDHRPLRRKTLLPDYWGDRTERLRRGYATGFYYPIELKPF